MSRHSNVHLKVRFLSFSQSQMLVKFNICYVVRSDWCSIRNLSPRHERQCVLCRYITVSDKKIQTTVDSSFFTLNSFKKEFRASCILLIFDCNLQLNNVLICREVQWNSYLVKLKSVAFRFWLSSSYTFAPVSLD